MKIIDVVEPFVKDYKPTVFYLDEYYSTYQQDYEQYFMYHCLHKEQKKERAIRLHPKKLPELLPMRDVFLREIPRIAGEYESMFSIQFTKDVHLLVGLYGSNAFTYRQYNPEVAFCLEKLPYNEKSIRLIIAHEFGHATHFVYSNQNNLSWDLVDWNSPYTWLLQEGIATYLSTRIVEADLDEYFSFEADVEWISFAQEQEARIASLFQEDVENIDARSMMKEWFSINGGAHLGVTRLGYYLGYQIVTNLLKRYDIEEILMLWEKDSFTAIMKEELQQIRYVSRK
ncbi:MULTISPECIES: DUF2268 domain-containing putative Zn-dependent protease [Pontibacillus]|uniref:DUF2268 domain-containing putative Zn-dependent protease n=1 Tax=Pontibacillus chungwhensis TaxID=265426 RepID=A0ABY8V3G0_9BACI|nr:MULTISPECIES: DUF2268 domain-containing putative Zn-dependent protease [Pontibacillus]MCD5324559.1 DUF2268 domain-containing putative Zn-dependent protease [Pontibacillus sp. HN14]WIF99145.1 DUF2268 domain-containing putative Zn-dependent protease [Pontibacillus chungwhensis]